MALPALKKRPNFSFPREEGRAIVNSERGQQTRYDEDKVEFKLYKFLQNVIERNGNLETRPGTLQLADIDDLLGIGKYQTTTEELLMGVVDEGTTSKIVEIDRTDGSTTDRVTGITGDGTPYTSSVGGNFYLVNGETDVVKFTDPSTDTTIALPNGEKAVLIASDEARVWVLTDAGVLRGSNVGVTTFTPTGTNLDRAFVATSGVSKGVALAGSGDFICLAGETRTEIHQVPDFARAGISSFTLDTKTLLNSYEGVGVKSSRAVVGADGRFWVKTTDGKLIVLTPGKSTPDTILTNEGRMLKFTHDQAALGFMQKLDLLIIACRDAGYNNHVFAYNIRKKNFSEFTAANCQEFVSFEDAFYYRSSVNNTIQNFLKDGQETDNGNAMDCIVDTVSDYGKTRSFFKVARDRILNVAVYGLTSFLYQFFADQRISDATLSPTKSETVEVGQSASPFGQGMPNFVGGFGMAGYNMSDGSELYTEYEDTDNLLNEEFWRAWCRLAFSASRKVVIRALGFNFMSTSKKVPPKTLT